MDRAGCKQVEIVPGKVSGAPILKHSRVTADAVLDSYELGESVQQIAFSFNLDPHIVHKSSALLRITSRPTLFHEGLLRSKVILATPRKAHRVYLVRRTDMSNSRIFLSSFVDGLTYGGFFLPSRRLGAAQTVFAQHDSPELLASFVAQTQRARQPSKGVADLLRSSSSPNDLLGYLIWSSEQGTGNGPEPTGRASRS